MDRMHFSGRRSAILLVLAAHARSVATLNVNNGRHFVFATKRCETNWEFSENSGDVGALAPILRHYLQQLRQNSYLIIRQSHSSCRLENWWGLMGLMGSELG